MATNLMYIIYKNDGSISKKSFPSYVNQGSSNVNEIFVAVEGLLADGFSVSGTFKLPNNTTNSVVFTSAIKTIDDLTYVGWKYTLTEAETYLSGILLLSLEIVQSFTTALWTYTAKITVNSTTYQPEGDDAHITNGQYNSLVAALNKKIDKFYCHHIIGKITNLNNEEVNVEFDLFSLSSQELETTIISDIAPFSIQNVSMSGYGLPFISNDANNDRLNILTISSSGEIDKSKTGSFTSITSDIIIEVSL